MGQDSVKGPARRSKLHHVDNKFDRKPDKGGGLFSPREQIKNPLEKAKPKPKDHGISSQAPMIKKEDPNKINIGENLRR